jgi:hypothetical protein
MQDIAYRTPEEFHFGAYVLASLKGIPVMNAKFGDEEIGASPGPVHVRRTALHRLT